MNVTSLLSVEPKGTINICLTLEEAQALSTALDGITVSGGMHPESPAALARSIKGQLDGHVHALRERTRTVLEASKESS